MSLTLRFSTVNLVEAAGVLLKNGTGGGAPALDEVSPYLMTNALKHDRRVLWQSSAGANMQFDLDLLSNKTVGLGGVAGHRALVGNGLAEFSLKYSTDANGYPPVSGNPWTLAPGTSGISVGSARRDRLKILNNAGVATTQSARYWRWDILLTAGGDKWTLGKVVLGVIDYDLGILMSPGRTRRLITPHIEQRSAGLDPLITYVGDRRYLFTIPFREVPLARRDTLEAIAQLTQSFFVFDETDTTREAIVQGAEFATSDVFVIAAAGVEAAATGHVLDGELNLEQLA